MSAMMTTSLTITLPVAADVIFKSTPLSADPTYAGWACSSTGVGGQEMEKRGEQKPHALTLSLLFRPRACSVCSMQAESTVE